MGSPFLFENQPRLERIDKGKIWSANLFNLVLSFIFWTPILGQLSSVLDIQHLHLGYCLSLLFWFPLGTCRSSRLPLNPNISRAHLW